jgi:acetoin utilization protein AcuC
VSGPHRTRVVWDEELVRYDFGPTHPMAPVRLDLTARLARALGVLGAPGVEVVGAPVPATDELVLTAHDAEYVAAVRRASADPAAAEHHRGLGTDDDPAFAGMHEASARVLAATVGCADAVWRGSASHAVNIGGGLHHAMRGRASGFCVYNDLVAAITHLLEAGAQRVAYVDVDVHHGDGVQAAFWDDPRVLTVSVHESPRTLFPGTGRPEDVGGAGALGAAVNLALPAGTGDRGWLRAVHAVVPPLLRAFAPQVLVTQHGCDSHALDPLAHLALSLDAQRATAALLHELAHEVAGGRWVATGGGGYEVVDVVPRAWSHLLAIAAHAPVDPREPVPPDWLEHVLVRLGRHGPRAMGDGAPAGHTPWESGYDDGDAVDRAVMATRAAVFPLHGLDAWFD